MIEEFIGTDEADRWIGLTLTHDVLKLYYYYYKGLGFTLLKDY
jgi:hypothetical protein